jgi:hypothetical protein
MCVICLLIQKANVLPTPKELVSHVGELNLTQDHAVTVYDKAIDKAQQLNMDTLEYVSELASEIQRDMLRKI